MSSGSSVSSSKAKLVHYSIMQSVFDLTVFLVFAIGQILFAIFKNIVPLSLRPRKNIEGEIALITGAGSGIGRLTALRLARLKVKVVIWDINSQGVQETVKLIKASGGQAYGYVCDLCKKEDVYRIAKQTQEEVGDVTILINNAGVVSGKSLLETPDELIQRTFDVNVISYFWTVKAFLPAMMKKNKGHIVTIASLAGYVGIVKLVDYCSSKHASIGFDEALRIELDYGGYFGIHTSCICPYFIQATGMFDNVQSRFLPTLNSNEVADRVVESILYNQRLVCIPKYLGPAIVLKQILPWSVLSCFLRALVPDAVPMHHGSDSSKNKEEVIKAIPTTENGKADPSDMHLSHRISTTVQERQP